MDPGVTPWVAEVVKQAGPFAVLLVILFWYVPRGSVPSFIKAQQDQAVALNALAEAVKNLPQRDEMKFEAILIGQEMTHNQIGRMLDELAEIKRGLNGKAQG